MSFFFFFSSRRRHTRCYRDWSSDVCSSDLWSTFLVGVPCSRCSRESLLTDTGLHPGDLLDRANLEGSAEANTRVLRHQLDGVVHVLGLEHQGLVPSSHPGWSSRHGNGVELNRARQLAESTLDP